jgi:transcriptional regulator with XRE-family HTH domain
MAEAFERPDPEVQAGQALRRLREAHGWTQEVAASRMRVYGYDFHQTTIAKIEAAQRPLRVRELVDFAALYGVEVRELIYAPSASFEEAEGEIASVETQLAAARERSEDSHRRLAAAQQTLSAVEAQQAECSREVAVLEGRLDHLKREGVRSDQRNMRGSESSKPDPRRIKTLGDFTYMLRKFWVWAGEPPFNLIRKRAGGGPDDRAIDAALNSLYVPSFETAASVIRGCGGSEEDVVAFAAAWERASRQMS